MSFLIQIIENWHWKFCGPCVFVWKYLQSLLNLEIRKKNTIISDLNNLNFHIQTNIVISKHLCALKVILPFLFILILQFFLHRETEDKLEYSEDQLIQKNEEIFNLSKMLKDEKQKVNYFKNLEERFKICTNFLNLCFW